MEYLEFDLTAQLICSLYDAKCRSLKIENTEQLRLRFVHQIQSHLPKGILDISSQKLTKMCAPAIVKLLSHLSTQITTLILDDNPLEDAGIISLTTCQTVLDKITTISLVSVGLSPEGCIEFLSSFATNSYIRSLNLGSNPAAQKRNRFNEPACKFLGQFFVQMQNLEEINFQNSQLRATNGYALFKFVARECALKRINLANTGVNNQAIKQLCTVNARNFPFLEMLDLSGNQTLTGDACLDIANLIMFQRRFHELYIKDCTGLQEQMKVIFEALGYGSAEQLAEQEAFKRRNAVREEQRNKMLCDLHFGIRNLIQTGKVIQGDEIPKKVVQQEQNLPLTEKTCAITHLDLTNLKISAQNLQIFADSLKENQSLQVCKLENCFIDLNRIDAKNEIEFHVPFQNFCEAIFDHSKIKFLNLSKNSILDIGAQYLFKVIQIGSLKTLNLNYCRIQNDGMVNIAKGLGSAKNIEKLYIAGNNCDDIAGQALFTNLQNYQKLKLLDISLNKISFQFSEKIQQLIKSNIEQSCSEIYQSLMIQVNQFEKSINELNFIDVETIKHRQEYNDLLIQVKNLSIEMVDLHKNCEEQLKNEHNKLEDLRVKLGQKEGELGNRTIKVNEIQTRLDQDFAICEQKKRIIREKTMVIQTQIEELEEVEKAVVNDELISLQAQLEKKRKEKITLEKDCVGTLAQLAACEAILVKENLITIIQSKKGIRK
ncbi:hypothetical protein SS50377_20132 [Spironucleus salmonicida]|uniref:Uncharacterized protein n=1 Tax=Spironucleus salmonicida TaxID=348837 RepID=V6LLV6_9EUKA|nr:hypothetical protein SS50377_20132 [Spironucleus salmonicida]|eukprot:EST45188.1 hypothetical protein SS50377_14761 [Spironucleus salmonicida]